MHNEKASAFKEIYVEKCYWYMHPNKVHNVMFSFNLNTIENNKCNTLVRMKNVYAMQFK